MKFEFDIGYRYCLTMYVKVKVFNDVKMNFIVYVELKNIIEKVISFTTFSHVKSYVKYL
jgi:hypothetical protein